MEGELERVDRSAATQRVLDTHERLAQLRATEEDSIRKQSEARARVEAIRASQAAAAFRADELRAELRARGRTGDGAPNGVRAADAAVQRRASADGPSTLACAPASNSASTARPAPPAVPSLAAAGAPAAEADRADAAARRRAAAALAARFAGLGALDALIAQRPPPPRADAREAERAVLRARVDEVAGAPVEKLLQAVNTASSHAALTDSLEVRLGAQRREHKRALHLRREQMRRQNGERGAFAHRQSALAAEAALSLIHI